MKLQKINQGSISTNKILFMIGLISAVVLILAAIWHNLIFSFFVGLLFNDAREFAITSTITSNFMPIGYSGFLGTCLKIGGVSGIPVCQSFIYIGIIFSAFWFLKLRGVNGILLVLGVLAISFHPMLLLNVWRIHDGNLTVLLLLGFLAAGISFLRFKNAWSVIVLGIFAGLLFTVRQNTILLSLIVFFLLGKNIIGGKIDYLKRAIIFLASALVLMVGVNFLVKQKPFFFGQQGAYNFFSGTNEYASRYLLKDLSGENSLEEALKSRGFSSVGTLEERLSFPSKTYTKLALDYIKSRPFEYLKLIGLKVFTLFRPGYQVVQNSGTDFGEILKHTLKIILAAPFFVWIFFVYRDRKNFFDKENFFVFLVVVFYLAPFLVANADPRYRFPLDIIFIADSFCRAKKLFVA